MVLEKILPFLACTVPNMSQIMVIKEILLQSPLSL